MDFITICKLSQQNLKEILVNEMLKYYKASDIVDDAGFLYVRGSNVLLTAHMDTVHKELVKQVVVEKHENQTIVSSPQGIGGDDRCGVYMILEILRKTKLRPTIIFCEDEEVGGVGSNKFCKSCYVAELKEIKFAIELDRANANDLVYYDCGNEEFMEFCSKVTGYKTAYGTFSDICHFSPELDVASVNISCGYYNQHTTKEYVVLEEMEATIDKVIELLKKENEVEKFDYQELFYNYGYKNYYGNQYGGGFHDWYESSYYELMITYRTEGKGAMGIIITSGYSYEECIGSFLIEHPDVRYRDIVSVENVETGEQLSL